MTTTPKSQSKKAPATFAKYADARRQADKEPLARPVWIETAPRSGDEGPKGHYINRKLGPVAYAKRRAQLDAAETLRRDFGVVPGATIQTILRHVSSSGMSRRIGLLVVDGGQVRDISRLAALAMDDKISTSGDGGIIVGGCGMDMGFSLVYNLGRALFPDGFTCPGKGCQSNDHNNPPHPAPRKGLKHGGDGGYALAQRWV